MPERYGKVLEKIIKNLIEAENKAHELIDKARLDRDWAVQLRQKEFNTIKKNKLNELNKTLAAESEMLKAELAAENEALTKKHIEEKQNLTEKYAKISEQLLAKLMEKVLEK